MSDSEFDSDESYDVQDLSHPQGPKRRRIEETLSDIDVDDVSDNDSVFLSEEDSSSSDEGDDNDDDMDAAGDRVGVAGPAVGDHRWVSEDFPVEVPVIDAYRGPPPSSGRSEESF